MKKTGFAKYTQLSAPPIRRMLTVERVKVLEKTLALIDARLKVETRTARRDYLQQKRQEIEAMLARAKKMASKAHSHLAEEASS